MGCVIDSKWSGGGGEAQVRFRPGGPGAVREPERRFSRVRRRPRAASGPMNATAAQSPIMCLVNGHRLGSQLRERVFGLVLVRLFLRVEISLRPSRKRFVSYIGKIPLRACVGRLRPWAFLPLHVRHRRAVSLLRRELGCLSHHRPSRQANGVSSHVTAVCRR